MYGPQYVLCLILQACKIGMNDPQYVLCLILQVYKIGMHGPQYVLCLILQAYKIGMYGPQYVWILHYGNDPLWMDKPTADGTCSSDVIKMVANGHFITSDVTLREDDIIPFAGMVGC